MDAVDCFFNRVPVSQLRGLQPAPVSFRVVVSDVNVIAFLWHKTD